MANFDQPNGFDPLAPGAVARKVTLGGTVTKGDPIAQASGVWVKYDASTHTAIGGVAAESGVSGEEKFAYLELQDMLFRCQVVTGTYAKATHNGGRYDITGAPGATGIDLSATTRGEVELVQHSPITGATEVGADARVAVKFVKLASADIPGTIQVNTINEATAAAGVTIDGVLLKDGEVTTDTINEETPAAGVTIDSVLCKDGALSAISAELGSAALTGDTVKPRLGVGDAVPSNSAGYGKGSIFVALDSGTAKIYVNTGTDASVTWTVAGTQT